MYATFESKLELTSYFKVKFSVYLANWHSRNSRNKQLVVKKNSHIWVHICTYIHIHIHIYTPPFKYISFYSFRIGIPLSARNPIICLPLKNCATGYFTSIYGWYNGSVEEGTLPVCKKTRFPVRIPMKRNTEASLWI